MPNKLIVADYFVHASVPYAELCLEHPVANKRGKGRKGGRKSEVVASTKHSRGPKRRRDCYETPAFLGVPNARRGQNIRSGCFTRAFSGAQKRKEWRRELCIFKAPQHEGRKPEVASSPLPSRGPKRGRKGYLTATCSGVPNKGEKIKSGCLNPAFSGPKRGRNCDTILRCQVTLPSGGSTMVQSGDEISSAP